MPALASDRRQLLRAGAWALPVVAVAAAAPAFAASLGANINVPGSTAQATGTRDGGNRETRIAATIQNLGQAATQNLTVRIAITGGSGPTAFLVPAGFSPPTMETSGNTVTFVFAAVTQLVANGGIVGPVVFGVKPGNNSATVVVSFTAANSPSKTFPSSPA